MGDGKGWTEEEEIDRKRRKGYAFCVIVQKGRDSLFGMTEVGGPSLYFASGKSYEKQFTGREYDRETGLYYFGARYLDPKTSRWLSVDPAVEDYIPEPGKGAEGLPGMGGIFIPVNLSVYHYSSNNPLKYADPDGEDYCYAIYSKKSQTLSVTYIPINKNGGIDYNSIKTASWAATNNPQPYNLNNPKEKLPYTMPVDGTTPQQYLPQTFPNGTWNVKMSETKNNDAFGPLSLRTDAQQEVVTYKWDKEIKRWVPSGKQMDGGYSVHGGGLIKKLFPFGSGDYPISSGYLYAPQENNRIEDWTHGCIRMRNKDVVEYAKLSDKALVTRNGKSTITVFE